MNERDLLQARTRLEKHLRRSVPDVVWPYLMEEELPQRAVQAGLPDVGEEGSEEWDELVNAAERELGKYDAILASRSARSGASTTPVTGRPPRSRQEMELDHLSDYESGRARSLSEYLAKRAATEGPVRGFRAAVLGGRLLTAQQAGAFLASPATHVLPRTWFVEQEVSVAEHTGTLVEYTRRRPDDAVEKEVYVHQAVVFVDPPGLSARAEYAGPPPKIDYEGPLVMHGGLGVIAQTIWPSSVLGEVHGLAHKLAQGYPWHEEDALWFVLTGEMPIVSPIKMEQTFTDHFVDVVTEAAEGDVLSHTYGTITLTVEPWMPATTVLRIYRAFQRQMLGGDNRELKDKSLTLLRFVIGHMDEQGRLPTWRILLKEWNMAYPQEAYGDEEQHVRNFARDYRNAEKAIAFPSYRRSRPPVQGGED